MDCMKKLPEYPDNFFDIAVVDPPYGIGEDGRRKRANNGRRAVKQTNGTVLHCRGDYDARGWDDEPPPQEYFDQLFRVSRHQIIWGINNFTTCRDLPIGPGRIFWDKCQEGSDFSDGELAYCSLHSSVRKFVYMWRGMMQGKSIRHGWIQQGNKKLNEKRFHPTQKPVALYRWITDEYIQPGWKVLDTHVGSASSLIAYADHGIFYHGYELDPAYYQESSDRLAAAVRRFSSRLPFPDCR